MYVTGVTENVPALVTALVEPVYCTRTLAGEETIFPVNPPLAVPEILVTVESGDVTVLCNVPVNVAEPFVRVTDVGLNVLPPLGESCTALVVRVQSTLSVKEPPPGVALTEPLEHETDVTAGTLKFRVTLAVPLPWVTLEAFWICQA